MLFNTKIENITAGLIFFISINVNRIEILDKDIILDGNIPIDYKKNFIEFNEVLYRRVVKILDYSIPISSF